jgi:predicted TIM-barrel fold metal-dependent hydrolase
MIQVVDVDQHINEPRTCWLDHIDPVRRADALRIKDDDLGYPWLVWRDGPIYLAEVQTPGRAKTIGEERLRIARGEPAEARYEERIPAAYTDPTARIAMLDRWQIDAAVLFPNFGLLWEQALGRDLGALCANMRAYNRWIMSVQQAGRGRLFGVAHVTLRDVEWLDAELSALARTGIKLAMVAPSAVDGKGLGHPSLDRIWSMFCSYDVAPVFHVGAFDRPIDRAWFADDPDHADPVMGSVFLWVPPALALAHMAIFGAFERHPDLRVGVVELSAHWVTQFILMLDGAWGFYSARHGGPPVDLAQRPSEYIRRHVRIEALAYEDPRRLVEELGPDLFMYGSDWPHAEGIAEPRAMYEAMLDGIDERARADLMGRNARWLLNV